MDENDSTDKKINISGTSNRYQIKKLISDSNTIIKKRKEAKNWDMPDELFMEEKQHDIVSSVYNNVAHDNWIKYNYICDNYITNPIYLKVILGQIETKVASYKQQDVLKKRYSDSSKEFNQCKIRDKSVMGWNFLYCIAFIYPEDGLNTVQTSHYHGYLIFFNLLSKILPIHYRNLYNEYLEKNHIIYDLD